MSGFGFPTSPLAQSSSRRTSFAVPPSSPQGIFTPGGTQHHNSPLGGAAFGSSPPAIPAFSLSPVGSPTGPHAHAPPSPGGGGGARREQYTALVLGDAAKQARCTSVTTIGLSSTAANSVLELFRRLDSSGTGALDAGDFQLTQAGALCEADRQRIAASNAMRQQIAAEFGLADTLRAGAAVDFEMFIGAFKLRVLNEKQTLPRGVPISVGQYLEQLTAIIDQRVQQLVLQMVQAI